MWGSTGSCIRLALLVVLAPAEDEFQVYAVDFQKGLALAIVQQRLEEAQAKRRFPRSARAESAARERNRAGLLAAPTSRPRPRTFLPPVPRAGPRAVFMQVGSRKGQHTASTDYDAGRGGSAYRRAPAYTLKALSMKKKTVRGRFSLRPG